MRLLIKTGVFALFAVQFFSCASIKVKRPEIDNVKSVAIIGYTTTLDLTHSSDQSTSTGFGGITNAIKNGANFEKAKARRKEQNEQTFTMMHKAIGEATGWNVLPRETVESNETYMRMIPTSGGAYLALPKMATWEIANYLDGPKRVELIKALGVDAIMWVRTDYVVDHISGFSVGGMGHTEKHLKGITRVDTWDSSTPEPVWIDLRAEGGASDKGIGRTMGIDSDENESACVLEAAQGTVKALAARYQEAKAKPVEAAK